MGGFFIVRGIERVIRLLQVRAGSVVFVRVRSRVWGGVGGEMWRCRGRQRDQAIAAQCLSFGEFHNVGAEGTSGEGGIR